MDDAFKLEIDKTIENLKIDPHKIEREVICKETSDETIIDQVSKLAKSYSDSNLKVEPMFSHKDIFGKSIRLIGVKIKWRF